MWFRQVETLVHFTQYQFPFHWSALPPVIFHCHPLQFPEAVSPIHKPNASSEVGPDCTCWSFLQPSRQDSTTEGIYLMHFYLFISSPPPSLLTARRGSVENLSPTFMLMKQEIAFFSAACTQRSAKVKVHVCRSFKDTAGSRGQPVQLLSLRSAPRVKWLELWCSLQEPNDLSSVGCRCVKEQDNSYCLSGNQKENTVKCKQGRLSSCNT